MKAKILIVLGLTSLLFGCYKEERAVNISLSDYLVGNYHPYRVEIQETSSCYFDLPMMLIFLSKYGQLSTNVFDYNGDGMVNTPDLLMTTAGFGNVYENNWPIYDATIVFQASSGWQINLEGWSICFLKVTPWDEEPPGSFIPNELKSFFLEGVLEDGTFIKVWYYRS
jgi:hypothetical protein